MSTIRFTLERGGAAELVKTDGTEVSLVASAAFPPGTPLELLLDGDRYRVKVRSCKKTDENPSLPFSIEGRFQNLTRAQRERVCG